MSDHHQQSPQQSVQQSSQQQQQQQQQSQQQQLISIKVMRLGKPVLQLNNDGKFLLKPDVDGHPQESDAIFKESLKIPSAFGSITAGEVLKCCICITNSSVIDINNVVLRVEINKYTNSSATQLVYKNVLLDTISQPVPTLTFGGKINHIVQHKVIDSGYHHIVCSVRYTRHMPQSSVSPALQSQPLSSSTSASTGGSAAAAAAANSTQQMTLRKSYGFNVGQPMSIQTRVHYLCPKEGHKWLVEAQAVAKVPVYLESFSLEPSDACTCKPLTPAGGDVSGCGSGDDEHPVTGGSKVSRFPAHLPRFRPLEKYFSAESVIHSVFEVSLKPNYRIPSTLGVINICWSGPFGSANRMTASVALPPEKAHAPPKAVPISLVGIVPESPSVRLYTPFALECTFLNMGTEPVIATVEFVENPASSSAGISLADHIALGDPIVFEPKKEVAVSFNLVALNPGLQGIGRLVLRDIATGKKLYFKELGTIVVL